MSNSILILGPSGSGKSSSFRNLDPKTTFIINVLNKPLPFRGSKKLYSDDARNYVETDRASKIVKYIEAVNERRPDITTLIIDDLTFVMNNEYMRRCQERQFTKFVDMGSNMFDIMDICTNTRPDLFCFLVSHTEVSPDGMVVPRTVGKMTNDYVGLGERVTVALHARIIDGEHKFLTNHDGTSYAKSPIDMFLDNYIDNDLNQVIDIIKAYNEGE